MVDNVVIEGGKQRVGNPFCALPFDNSNSPLARYDFDRDTLDSSGNGEDLTLANGTEIYVPGYACGGQLGLELNGATTGNSGDRYTRAIGPSSALVTPDEVTIQVLTRADLDQSPTSQLMIGVGAPGEGAAANVQWSLYLFDTNNSGTAEWGILWEQGSGSNVETRCTEKWKIYDPTLLTVVRTINANPVLRDLKFFMNGRLIDTILGVAEPTGGTDAGMALYVGAFTTGAGAIDQQYNGVLYGVKIYDTALTDAQVLTEAQRVIPLKALSAA